MHPNIKHLVELQVVDLRLAELGALLETFPKRLKEIDARAAAARQHLAAAKASRPASGVTKFGSLADREGQAGNYLYVAFVRTSKSRCGVKSTMEVKAGPPSGFDLIASCRAALTLSRPAAFAAM